MLYSSIFDSVTTEYFCVCDNRLFVEGGANGLLEGKLKSEQIVDYRKHR